MLSIIGPFPTQDQFAQAKAMVQSHVHAALLTQFAAELALQISQRNFQASNVAAVAQRIGLNAANAQTDFGNILSIFERGAQDSAERAVASAFIAAGALQHIDADLKISKKWAKTLCFLAVNTPFEPFLAMPDNASLPTLKALYLSIADHARAMYIGQNSEASRAELIVAVAALAEAVERGLDDEIAQLTSRLAADVNDPIVQRILTAQAANAPVTQVQTPPEATLLKGQWASLPRSTFATIVATFTGWILIQSFFRVMARWVFGFRRDARLELTQKGLEFKAKTTLLGREIQNENRLLPYSGLSYATRDVRFPSLPIYVGLFALLVGTYMGVSLLSWGTQAASPRLIGYGALILSVGILIDALIFSLVPSLRGRCRVLIIPKKGKSICLSEVEQQRADRLLGELARWSS